VAHLIELKISLIHATPLAMQPIAQAFEQLWPAAQRMNVLDDRLSQDRAANGALTEAMVERVVSLARYAKAAGAHGILFTCSAFGPAIDEAARAVNLPTLKPNEAMFDEALDLCGRLGGTRRIGLLTTFAPAGVSMEAELREASARRTPEIVIVSACASGAMEALNAGDTVAHDRLVVQRAAELSACDVLMLGQFSMARAESAVSRATGKPVLTSPGSAVRRMGHILSGSF
jgi:Asp/Glu/Hydantoin racemase